MSHLICKSTTLRTTAKAFFCVCVSAATRPLSNENRIEIAARQRLIWVSSSFLSHLFPGNLGGKRELFVFLLSVSNLDLEPVKHVVRLRGFYLQKATWPVISLRRISVSCIAPHTHTHVPCKSFVLFVSSRLFFCFSMCVCVCVKRVPWSPWQLSIHLSTVGCCLMFSLTCALPVWRPQGGSRT